MKLKIVYILLLSFFSCQKNKHIQDNKANINSEEVITINQITTIKDTLAYNIRKKGDRDSYDELFYSMMESTKEESTDSVMVYSKIMAEKYHYEKAYFDYFQALCRKYNISYDYGDYSTLNLSKMDNTAKKKAIYWLNKMIKNNLITKQQYDSIKK
ncbi:hypothetical protein SAMN05444671_3835 [Flavobacterium sp. CF108]|uniref:hypothetical protein n=1 Tax=unclassified Flavobacterium TaxID=196869 RepID=UPI0008D4E07C|nr:MULTISPECIES: hypothetical protein [unclassified Flavobacterium]SEO97350.1 hypothetical protein SAMN04487978_4136 [Flavobacterium sp. fv08]SHH80687.1 hypothetical protein SAMN05444671_3835 [Flavobacterium sp. CF108]